jgi:exopolysaccharide production protein ExoY
MRHSAQLIEGDELPEIRLTESTDADLTDCSTRRAILQPHRRAGEKLRRKEASARPPGQAENRGPRPHFHVIGQRDPAETGSETPKPRTPSSSPISESLKRAFDLLGAVVLGLVFLPLILAIVVLLRRQGGPILFRHRRVGRNGQAFYCLKFRTMVPDADRVLRDLLEGHPELKAEWLRDHKLRIDPRITAVGRFLRRTSLDELPQLWNVVRGQMSMVGPRPVVREELLRYGRHLNRYLSARPGLTGMWQVMGRNNTDYRRRVVLDVYYIRRRSVTLDLYILLKTTRVVLCGSGAY